MRGVGTQTAELSTSTTTWIQHPKSNPEPLVASAEQPPQCPPPLSTLRSKGATDSGMLGCAGVFVKQRVDRPIAADYQLNTLQSLVPKKPASSLRKLDRSQVLNTIQSRAGCHGRCTDAFFGDIESRPLPAHRVPHRE